MTEKVAILGLGYVGLPVALAAARAFPGTVGFDTRRARIDALRRGEDETGETSREELRKTTLVMSDDPASLAGATFFIVAVPTPIDADHRPDLRALQAASRTVGAAIRRGGCVVVESTVYPGLVEELCGPWIAERSGLSPGVDFVLGYSPERINPGDREHRLESIVKVVAGQDGPTLERVAAVYSSFVNAGVYRAPSIKVAEAAKVLENTQRDLNIALMNELALICDRLGLRTKDVLEVAATKWNFQRYTPGLVGGHCIGVDPYYLTTKAEQLGIVPQVILAGRRINNEMGVFVAQKCVKLLAAAGADLRRARVGVLGLTFKENVGDLRNSRVPDVIRELCSFGCEPLVHDPLAPPGDAKAMYGLSLQPFSALSSLDALIIAVPHASFSEMPPADLVAGLKPGGVVIDVKSMLSPSRLPPGVRYWSL